ncbi:GDP-L-fucose synthase [soil metagenome]
MNPGDTIYVAGHRGMVGSAIVRKLEREGFSRIIVRERNDLDLRNRAAVDAFVAEAAPDYVFVAAAVVGGIQANDTYPVEFLRDNLAIELNLIGAAHRAGVSKLLFLGSSCVYPRLAPQPMREEHLLTGSLEPTNQWYAVAKIAGIKLCQAYRKQYRADFISVMPTNLYGPNDNFDLETAHVLPALIRRFHEAKEVGAREVMLWGTGSPRREFLHVDDLADACVFLMQRPSEYDLVNVGVGEDLQIRELAAIVAEIVGYEGSVRYDASKPDGTPRKLLDLSRMHGLGWRASIGLHEGIAQTYAWFRSQPPARQHARTVSL